MRTPSGTVLLVTALSAMIGVAGCGGGDESSSSAPVAAAEAPRTADYELARMSDLGLREAFVTLTERSDGKTTAVVDFYVPREGGARDAVYPTAIRAGGCSDTGDVEHDLGRLSAGTSVLVLDAGVDEVASTLDEGLSTVAIMAPDGSTVAWCGPTVAG